MSPARLLSIKVITLIKRTFFLLQDCVNMTILQAFLLRKHPLIEVHLAKSVVLVLQS